MHVKNAEKKVKRRIKTLRHVLIECEAYKEERKRFEDMIRQNRK